MKSKTTNHLLVVLLFLFFCHCAPTRLVKPLQKNTNAVLLTFGGPLIRYSGAPVPLPFTTVGYARGVTSNLTMFGTLHTTSLLFGNLQTDIGTTIGIYKKENVFGISITPALQVAYNLTHQTGFRLWPSADLNGYFHLNKKPSFIYCGTDTWFELSNLRAHDEIQQRHVLPNLHVGYMLVKNKWQQQIELKYLGPGIADLPNVADYIGISGKGVIGIYYSVYRKF